MKRIGLLAASGLERPTFGARLRQRLAEQLGVGADIAAGQGGCPLPPGASVDRDVAYGDDPAQCLDIYRPAAAKGAAVIVFVHGGGWRRGDKAMPRMVRNKMAHWTGQGHIFVAMNYRMLPAAGPLEQAADVAAALAFVQRQAGGWGGDAARVVLTGHSAGAHLVSLVTAEPGLASRYGAQPWLATVALDSAALDIEAIMTRPHYRFYDPVFGSDPAFWRAASPIHRLSAAPAAPMLLVSSSRREDSLAAANAFSGKARALGGRVEVLSIDLDHMALNDLLGTRGDYTAAVDAFLQSVGLG